MKAHALGQGCLLCRSDTHASSRIARSAAGETSSSNSSSSSSSSSNGPARHTSSGCSSSFEAPRRQALAAATVLVAQQLLAQPRLARAGAPPSEREVFSKLKDNLDQFPAGQPSSEATREGRRDLAEDAGVQEQFQLLEDGILSYKFIYPVAAEGKKLSLLASRKPERYSSAAPLAANARQRIVSELVDFTDRATITVTVGPSSGVLKGQSPEQWAPKDVAQTVLADKLSGLALKGQKLQTTELLSLGTEERDSQKYWVFRHSSQGSPTGYDRTKETFRRTVSVTSIRPGLSGQPYLYTLSLACPEDSWPVLGPLFEQSAESFRLLPTGKEYVPPDKDWWRFF